MQKKRKIKKYYKNINEKIDLFYKISNTTKIDYVTKGISSLHMTLYPENVIKLPLEILFKIIHSTSQIPLIKYNPGSNYENIYRLFTDNNISVSGIKVPTLFILNNSKKTKILNISKTLSKYQSVGFYIEYTFKRTIIEIFCEFFENGSIDIKFESEILLEPSDVNKIIKKTINDNILNTVRNYLKQSGYEYITFTNLKTPNVEINSIKYEFKLKNKKKMNISKYIGCISAIFNIIEGKASQNNRYNRISL